MNSTPETEDQQEPEEAPVQESEEQVEDSQEPAADPIAELQAKADENWHRYLRAAAEM